jgi:hypothetical protein
MWALLLVLLYAVAVGVDVAVGVAVAVGDRCRTRSRCRGRRSPWQFRNKDGALVSKLAVTTSFTNQLCAPAVTSTRPIALDTRACRQQK